MSKKDKESSEISQVYFRARWNELTAITNVAIRTFRLHSIHSHVSPSRSKSHARARCKTCPFIHNANKISGPKRSIKITDHFTCISANVIYCITCTYCKKIYIGETGRRLGDRFREHLRDVERNDKDAAKPVARHFNLPNHSKQHMAICGVSLHLGSLESRKTLEQKCIFQIETLNPIGINERFSFY